MKTIQDIQPFADLLAREQLERMKSDGYDRLLEAQPNYCETSIKMGRKYANVDFGCPTNRSGMYMVDLETGTIYGIKGYGVVHRGHVYGTLDTIHEWHWSADAAFKKVSIKNIMKNKIKLTLAICAAAILVSTQMHKASADNRPPAGAVVFSAEQNYVNGYPIGFVVYVISQGAHAPQILPGSELAPVLETLLANGFEIKETASGLNFIATRK